MLSRAISHVERRGVRGGRPSRAKAAAVTVASAGPLNITPSAIEPGRGRGRAETRFARWISPPPCSVGAGGAGPADPQEGRLGAGWVQAECRLARR